MEAARKLFVKEGYNSVSMRKIAEKIEYSPTTIYLYFKDKQDLIHHLCESTFAKLVKELEGLSQDSSDPVGNLRRAGRAYIQFGLRYPNHYLVTFVLPHTHLEMTPEGMEKSQGMRAFHWLRMMVAECIRQGKFRPVDIEATSQTLWAAVHGVTSLLIVHTDFPWVHKEKLVEQMLDSLLEGLKA
jgi:AcrR family transcriptional regulator